MRILSIDVGGSGLKAAVLNTEGEMVTERVRVKTPQPCPPDLLVDSLSELVSSLPDYDRVSVGFPGVVRKGKILTAPNLGTEMYKGFDLASALESKLGKPVRVVNDADMQGYGAIMGEGVEVVITLGTGFGSSIFVDGRLGPHLEFAHHPFRKGQTYEEQLGNRALDEVGKKRWNQRLGRAIGTLRILTSFDRLHIGGGNAKEVELDLDPDVRTVSNLSGLRGGAWLWRE
jgi:polyphosphate glucokinase